MVTIYICKNAECPHLDLVYRMEDAPNGAMCGGCREWLEPDE